VSSNKYSFIRYLAAKKSVDDRALNRQVLQVMGDSLRKLSNEGPLKVLEIGAGIGTMIERLIEWDLLDTCEYTAIDSESENIDFARQRLLDWADQNHFQIVDNGYELQFSSNTAEVLVKLLVVDLFDFLEQFQVSGSWDLLVAHAFLDLVDVPNTLPCIFKLARNAGLFYFSINYDGLTVLEPEIDPEFDHWVLELYHRTMEQRMRDDRHFGDRFTGRHLFQHVQESGGRILASGSSDWVVYPGSGDYHQDEAYFLHFIIDTISLALEDNPELDHQKFVDWIHLRHDQIDRKELVYIAHQLDYFGICSSN
jgi:SAM-dependent methyltransferase